VTSAGSKTPYVGIAPGVNIINLRVLDQNGNGTDSSVIQGIEAAISLANTYNIRVINLSLGRPVFESYAVDPLCQAVEQAWKAGIVVVVAAGNQGRNNSVGSFGYGTITAPGNDPYVITVGAMKIEGPALRTNDLIASYSSKGPTLFDHIVKPDIVAPGNLIISTMAGGTLRNEFQSTNQVNSNFLLRRSAARRRCYFSRRRP
jgi:serine protease AprX